MAFSSGLGLELNLERVPCSGLRRDDFLLFSESNSRFLVEVSKDKWEDFEEAMEGCVFSLIGVVSHGSKLVVHGTSGRMVVEEELGELRRSWKKTFGG